MLWYNNATQMGNLVASCKRRGFLFPLSEIYGGLNGFWDYGPLGVLLKRNVKDAWWNDRVMSHNELVVKSGATTVLFLQDCARMMALPCRKNQKFTWITVASIVRMMISRVACPVGNGSKIVSKF